MVTSKTGVIHKLGYDPIGSPRAQAPNPLTPATAGQKRLFCSVLDDTGQCTDYVAYWETYTEHGLCTRHARVINDLPDMVARRQAQMEMTAQMLVNMTTDAVRTVGEIMNDPSAPEAVRLKAADLILSKTGFASGQRVEISAPTTGDDDGPSPGAELIRKRLDALAAGASSLRAPESEPEQQPEVLADSGTDG